MGEPEGSVGGGSPGVNDPLGNPLVVEVHDLLAEVKIVEKGRATVADPQAVVSVVHRYTVGGGKGLTSLGPIRSRCLRGCSLGDSCFSFTRDSTARHQ